MPSKTFPKVHFCFKAYLIVSDEFVLLFLPIHLSHSLTKPGSGTQQKSVSEVMEGFDSKQREKCQTLKLRSKH